MITVNFWTQLYNVMYKQGSSLAIKESKIKKKVEFANSIDPDEVAHNDFLSTFWLFRN